MSAVADVTTATAGAHDVALTHFNPIAIQQMSTMAAKAAVAAAAASIATTAASSTAPFVPTPIKLKEHVASIADT